MEKIWLDKDLKREEVRGGKEDEGKGGAWNGLE